MQIYVVRHGKTDWNKEGKLQGRVNVPLNEEGIKQANQIKEKLKGIMFDVCFASPLNRVMDTAKIIVSDVCNIVPEDLLLERDLGELEGCVVDDFSVIKQMWDCKLNSNMYQIETMEKLLSRTKLFLNKLSKLNVENVLVVSHGGTLKALHYNIIGYDETTDFLSFMFDNCEVKKYEI